jgi:peptidoglycan/LPS O-acetylase OafA/YrhL
MTAEVPAAQGARPAAEPTLTPARRQLGFVPAFNGVRAVAVLLVVSFHMRMLDPWLYGRVVPRGGSLGVDIFFVLSGFLITALLLREQARNGSVRFRGFYRRRALRLLPALAFLLLAQICFAYADNVRASLERSSLLSAIFYYANWKIAYAHSIEIIAPGLAHLWSLSVEEQFYIVWPLVLVVFLGVQRRLSTVLAVMVGAIIAVCVLRAHLLQTTAPGRLYFRTDMRADSLLMGALAAQLWTHRKVPRKFLQPAAWLALVVVMVFVVFVGYESRFMFYGGFTLFALAVAVVLLAIVETSWLPNRALSVRWLCAIGIVSYGLYLWHYFIFAVLADHTDSLPTAARISAGLALTAAATTASWFLVERRFLRLKRR